MRVSSRAAMWLQILDLPMLISVGGVAAVLLAIQVLSWAGVLVGAPSARESDKTMARWVTERERAMQCQLVQQGDARLALCPEKSPADDGVAQSRDRADSQTP